MNLDNGAFDGEFAALVFEQARAVHQLALVDLDGAASGIEERNGRQGVGALAPLGRSFRDFVAPRIEALAPEPTGSRSGKGSDGTAGDSARLGAGVRRMGGGGFGSASERPAAALSGGGAVRASSARGAA